MNLRWSITARLVCTTIVIASFAMAIFTVLIVGRLESGYQQQRIAVGELAHTRLSQQLHLQAKLLSKVLGHLAIKTRDAGFSIAADPALKSAMVEGSAGKIGEVLTQIVKSSQFDSLLAIDPNMQVVGGDGLKFSPEKVARIIEQPYTPKVRGVVLANDSSAPFAYSGFEIGKEENLRAFGIEVSEDKLTIVTIHPIFDWQGKVMAVLLGHRLISPDEPSIKRVDHVGALGLRIFSGNQALLSASLAQGNNALPKSTNLTGLSNATDGKHLSTCRPFPTNLRLCVYRPESELDSITQGLAEFIKVENAALLKWLLALAAIIMILSVVTTWVCSNKIIAPLRHIAYAVHSVAKGNWLAQVKWVKRRDEVGEIARAVAVLQMSMKERERLRSDVAKIEQLKSQQSEMEQAVEQSQVALRQCLFNLSDYVETVELGSKKLTGMAGLAAGEADETRLVTSRLMVACPEVAASVNGDVKGSESVILDSFDRLGETIGELKEDTEHLSQHVVKLIHEAQSVNRIVKHLMSSVSNGKPLVESDQTPQHTGID